MSPSELELDLGTTTINCTADEIASGLGSLLREIRLVARKLRPDERVALRLIMSHPSGTLTVGEVFREFARESESHKTLRRFRAAQFVRPARHGSWNPDEPIEVKPFARLLWDRVGEGEIFAEADVVLTSDVLTPDEEPAAAPAEPVAEEGAEPVAVAVAAEPAEEVPPAEPADVEAAAAKLWEDDSVVDLADVDDFRHYVEEELRQNK